MYKKKLSKFKSKKVFARSYLKNKARRKKQERKRKTMMRGG